MKNYFVLVGLVLSLGLNVWAEVPVSLTGDISILSVISQKPSSVQNRSAFQMPEGRLGANWQFDPDFSLGGELVYGKARDSVNGRYNLQLETLFLEARHLLFESHWLQYGLVVHPWEALEEGYWGYRFLGARAPALGFRYGYLNRSDLGVVTGSQPAEYFKWSVMVVNGEGAGADEAGPKKDLHFIVEGQPFENWRGSQKVTLAFLWVEGAFDNVDPELAQKERFALLLGLESDSGFVGSLELMASRDPVDGINQTVADKVDLSAQGGQVARSQGASLIGKWRGKGGMGRFVDKPIEAFARIDFWNPALGVSAKGLRSQLLGIGFFPRQNLQLSLAWSEVQYENNHAASVRDSADLLFAARLKW